MNTVTIENTIMGVMDMAKALLTTALVFALPVVVMFLAMISV